MRVTMTARLLAAAVLASTVLAACGGGGGIEGRVRSEYAGYAARQHFAASAMNVGSVRCDKDATSRFDGWCRIRPKGFRLTYDVPYRGGKPLWGDSGLSRAPSQ